MLQIQENNGTEEISLVTLHYNDVIMGTITSQISSLTIVFWTVCSHADQRKHWSSASLAFVQGIGEFPAQMASNAENVSIWGRHHVTPPLANKDGLKSPFHNETHNKIRIPWQLAVCPSMTCESTVKSLI